MRDPARIQEMLRLIHEIWSKYPDVRFNQLIHNLQSEYTAQSKDWSKTLYEKIESPHMKTTIYHEVTVNDLFSLEDDLFLRFLENKNREAK